MSYLNSFIYDKTFLARKKEDMSNQLCIKCSKTQLKAMLFLHCDIFSIKKKGYTGSKPQSLSYSLKNNIEYKGT